MLQVVDVLASIRFSDAILFISHMICHVDPVLLFMAL